MKLCINSAEYIIEIILGNVDFPDYFNLDSGNFILTKDKTFSKNIQCATKLQEMYPSLALSTNYALFAAKVLVTLALPSGMSLFSPQKYI